MENTKENVVREISAEELSDLLFAKYQKAREEVKEGQPYPVWFDHKQLQWIKEVVEENYL